jgi:hypothetical protein
MNFVAAALFAVCSSTLLALALAFFRGGLSPMVASVSLSFGALVAAATLWRGRNDTSRSLPPRGWEWGAVIAFALVCARMFLWLVFREGDDIKVISPNNLGDLSLHITYINYLASGVSFWPDNPIFSSGRLTYPVGVDLFNSLLSLLGVDLLRGLIWTGLAGCAMTGVALWRWGRGWALFGFLANGGLFGFAVFQTLQIADFQSEFAWKSFALALLATQRGLLFALPAGLLLLCSWRTRYFAQEAGGWKLSRMGELLLYAAMPLFHLHTFLFLSLLLASWFVMRESARRALAGFVAAAFAPASVLVLLVTGMMKGASVIGFKAGWMWDDDAFLKWCGAHFALPPDMAAAIFFIPMNFGLLPVFVAALCEVIVRRRDDDAAAFVIPALFAFVLCCFVKFAPWEWDNTKIMVWSYVVTLPYLWSHLVSRWPWVWRALTCVALFFSGFVSTLGGLDVTHTGYSIASRAELAGVAAAVRGIPVSSAFVGTPTYNHPLLLCGRKMALGYTGHVSSHGLPWREPAAKVDALMRGADDWRQLAEELGVRYLFWGRYEQEEYVGSREPWRDVCPVVALGDWGEIFDLQRSRPAESAPAAVTPR